MHACTHTHTTHTHTHTHTRDQIFKKQSESHSVISQDFNYSIHPTSVIDYGHPSAACTGDAAIHWLSVNKQL